MNNSIFREPEEKGFSEHFTLFDTDPNKVAIVDVLVALAIVGLLLWGIFFGISKISGSGEITPEAAAVVEVDGVLYYPDGNPVRNYEQLHLYLNAK